jgi:hypothetical protein
MTQINTAHASSPTTYIQSFPRQSRPPESLQTIPAAPPPPRQGFLTRLLKQWATDPYFGRRHSPFTVPIALVIGAYLLLLLIVQQVLQDLFINPGQSLHQKRKP